MIAAARFFQTICLIRLLAAHDFSPFDFWFQRPPSTWPERASCRLMSPQSFWSILQMEKNSSEISAGTCGTSRHHLLTACDDAHDSMLLENHAYT